MLHDNLYLWIGRTVKEIKGLVRLVTHVKNKQTETNKNRLNSPIVMSVADTGGGSGGSGSPYQTLGVFCFLYYP